MSFLGDGDEVLDLREAHLPIVAPRSKRYWIIEARCGTPIG
jgi:hypothetical protein